MANQIIFTDVFRVSYAHLVKPQEPQNPNDVPKFGLSMQFPKSGICPANNQPSSYVNIQQAIAEVAATVETVVETSETPVVEAAPVADKKPVVVVKKPK